LVWTDLKCTSFEHPDCVRVVSNFRTCHNPSVQSACFECRFVYRFPSNFRAKMGNTLDSGHSEGKNIAHNKINLYINEESHGIVGIATSYGLDDREIGVRVQIGSRILISPYRPHRLWDPSNLLFNGFQRLFPSGGGGGLITHLQLVPTSRKHASIHPLPHTSSWRSAWLSTGTTQPFIHYRSHRVTTHRKSTRHSHIELIIIITQWP
jgi:hypothetical protein